MMFNLIFLGLPLNLNFIEILIHLVNLFIIYMAFRLILYKPIRKKMKERSDQIEKEELERQNKLQEANFLKQEYNELLSNAKSECLNITNNAQITARNASEEIINEAKEKASLMMKNTSLELKRKEEEQINNLKIQICDIASTIAEEILKRELSSDDINKNVEDVIKNWSNN